jgi:hypothetical protein
MKLAIATAVAASFGSMVVNEKVHSSHGFVNRDIRRVGMGPAGSPKRNQERARKAMAANSRRINRMRDK